MCIDELEDWCRANKQTLESAAREIARELLDTMETCHICKGALILQEHPVHCENCSGDCENHEEPECTPIYILHARLKKALELERHFNSAAQPGWPIPNSSDKCKCGDIFASHIHSGVAGGHTFADVGGSLLRKPGSNPPEGCYCKPSQCMAPVIMGRQMPCRDPEKAKAVAAQPEPGKCLLEPHPEDFCHECKQPNITWHAESWLWNKVMRRGDAPEPILCPVCFAKRAQAHGIESWRLIPDPILYPEGEK